jgi:hypothetical protein
MKRAQREREDDEDAPAGRLGSGAAQWKDTGVYVDGQPVGMLRFGELPIKLVPVWVSEKVSAPKRPRSNDPGWRWVKQRHYRFTEYLAAVGVDLARVKEVQVYGPRFSQTIVVGGPELRRRGRDFLFHFGGDVSGKAIPAVPPHFGNGKSPDKITAVMVYVARKPPTLVWNVGLELDGKVVTDVPYHGEPLRGGVRVYFDDRLAAVIKRKLLPRAQAEPASDGRLRWKLFPWLESQGVDTGKIVEAWLVRAERRTQRLSRAQLVDATFESTGDGSSGSMLFGADRLPANALALHSRPVQPAELPRILPDEGD